MENNTTSVISVAAPRVNIISDETVHPPLLASKSILRSFIETGIKHNQSREVTTSLRGSHTHAESTKNKLSLLDGLGEDFLANPAENNTDDFYMKGLEDAFFAADPSETKKEEIAPQAAKCLNQITDKEFESDIHNRKHTKGSRRIVPITMSRVKHSTAVSSLKNTLNPYTTKIEQVPTSLPVLSLSEVEEVLLKENCPRSPIIAGSKRKIPSGGKDLKKIKRSSSKEKPSSSLASSSCQFIDFSQSDDKTVITKFKKVISDAVEKKKFYEGQLEESGQQQKLIVRRREEAEAQQQINDVRIREAFEEMKQLKKSIAELKATARENGKFITSIRVEEKQLVTTHHYNQEQLDKYSRKLTSLQQIFDTTI